MTGMGFELTTGGVEGCGGCACSECKTNRSSVAIVSAG